MHIVLENIEKSYDRPVLKSINYTFESGKIYVIKGVSGCGKTTLFNIIGGLEKDFSGKVNKDGITKTTGYIFQDSLLLSHITIKDNLLLIKNDESLIINLCESVGVAHLLEKLPEQISGGERQRVAIVRALLLEPQILLADEPTASLDDANSENIAEIIFDLKSENRIILVATHEHYFDELADEIIYLKYGEIDKVEKRNFDSVKKKTALQKETLVHNTCKKKNLSLIKYNIKRNKFRLLSLLPFVIMFFLIMFVSTLQNNFAEEYMHSVKEKYPVDAFNISNDYLKNLSFRDEVGVYDYYSAVEDDVIAYYLAKERDSVLAIDGMIEYGRFPVNDNEILVTQELLVNKFNESDNFEKYVGETLNFMNKEFVISGVLFAFGETDKNSLRNENFELYLNSDIYYFRIKGNIIFIPYNTINKFLEPQEKEYSGSIYMRAYYRDLFEDTDGTSELRAYYSNGSINIFENIILKSQRSLDNITRILLIVFFVCFVISCLFMSSQIYIELFYRRKELGYLQIFGLKKHIIKKIVLMEYMMKIIVSLAMSVALYLICMIIYFAVVHHWTFFNWIHILIIVSGILLVYFLTVLFTLRKFIKRDVMRLLE